MNCTVWFALLVFMSSTLEMEVKKSIPYRINVIWNNSTLLILSIIQLSVFKPEEGQRLGDDERDLKCY